MTKFKDMFACELYKINRKHTLLKLGIALLVFLIATTIFFAVIESVLADMIPSGSGDLNANIESLKAQIKTFEENATWLNRLLPDKTLYGLKANLAMYEYMSENGITSSGVMSVSSGADFLNFDYYNFTETCMSTVMSIMIIFLIVACCRATTGEYASGALKMQFIRPVDKNKFFTAKWLSVFVVSEAFLILSFIVSFVLGVILFGADCPSVILVMRAKSATITSAFGVLVLSMFCKSVTLFLLVQATMFICSFSKTNVKSLVICLLMFAFDIGILLENILAVGYVGFVGFIANLDWMSAFSLTGPAFKGMSLWTMVPITLLWGAFFMYMGYRRFNRIEV